MSKHGWQVCDWILFYDEGRGHGNVVKAVAVGSKAAGHSSGTVIKGFRGTYPEAKAEANRLNETMKIKNIFHYERSSKNDRRRKEAARSVYSGK